MNTPSTTKLSVKRSTVKTAEGYSYPTYKIVGRIEGRRIRKQFTSEQEALGEKHRLEVFAANQANAVRPAVTRLTPAQLADAEAAFSRLDDKPLSLAVDWLLSTYTAPVDAKPLDEAVEAFLTDWRTHARPATVNNYERVLPKLKKALPRKCVHEVTTDDIVRFLDKHATKRSRNTLRKRVSAFFGFCKKMPRRWTKENPVSPVPALREGRGLPEVLGAKECETLMRHVEGYTGCFNDQKPGCLVPYFALALFAGMRPSAHETYGGGEIMRMHKAGATERLIDLKAGVIRITPEISKTGYMRQITIRPNLRAWLERYPLSEYPIAFEDFHYSLAKVRRKFKVGRDVLRHTFISMHVAKHQSLGAAALEAGNSEAIIRKHYLNMRLSEDAELFWGIMPK